jgi:hypothetical protein
LPSFFSDLLKKIEQAIFLQALFEIRKDDLVIVFVFFFACFFVIVSLFEAERRHRGGHLYQEGDQPVGAALNRLFVVQLPESGMH